jgi:hypothetical protein
MDCHLFQMLWVTSTGSPACSMSTISTVRVVRGACRSWRCCPQDTACRRSITHHSQLLGFTAATIVPVTRTWTPRLNSSGPRTWTTKFLLFPRLFIRRMMTSTHTTEAGKSEGLMDAGCAFVFELPYMLPSVMLTIFLIAL